jgi:RNA polymerase sigma factor (sigma-70 family)
MPESHAGTIREPDKAGAGEPDMADSSADSVTIWLASLKAGDEDAAQKLWRRYFEDLVHLARDRLRTAPKAVADEEDAALSAFDSFVRGAARGRYPLLDDRDDLWRLLVVITERKALDQAQRERRQKRGGGKVLGSAALADGDLSLDGLAEVAAPEPTPEFAAQMADECRRLLGRLRDDSLRVIAGLRMEGYTQEEIADQLGCSLRTVSRKVELIRRTWLDETRTAS